MAQAGQAQRDERGAGDCQPFGAAGFLIWSDGKHSTEPTGYDAVVEELAAGGRFLLPEVPAASALFPG